MNYRVIWRNAATRQLTEHFANAMQRGEDTAAITRAVATLDQRFQGNPASVGESRSGGERIAIQAPLSVYFEVHDEERIVIVLSVRYRRRR
jgi:hypothetical protein